MPHGSRSILQGWNLFDFANLTIVLYSFLQPLLNKATTLTPEDTTDQLKMCGAIFGVFVLFSMLSKVALHFTRITLVPIFLSFAAIGPNGLLCVALPKWGKFGMKIYHIRLGFTLNQGCETKDSEYSFRTKRCVSILCYSAAFRTISLISV
jgi:hypothetical protein